MILTPPLYKAVSQKKLKVWVLAPGIHSDNAHIDYYYDFSHSIGEYTRVFEELDIPWVWEQVNMSTFPAVISKIEAEQNEAAVIPVVLNLCDGDEINGAPGVSVLKMLNEKNIVHTGSDEHFYRITTSKIPMKKAFEKAGVPTGAWVAIHKPEIDAARIFKKTGRPVILKPAVSGGSMGVGVKNVIEDEGELEKMVKELFGGYGEWDLTTDGILAEQFIAGPEFTTFITGSHQYPKDAVVYDPVERVFHPSLPEKERFLSFERLWEIYENETPMPKNENFYEYRTPDAALIKTIKKLSWDAYCATGGTGYTRVDLRMDDKTGKIYVLEVNAQCGLSEDEDHTSIGAILRLGGKPYSGAIMEIINDAFVRARAKKQIFAQAGKRSRA